MYGLHDATVATRELAFVYGFVWVIKPRQMFEGTTKKKHIRKKNGRKFIFDTIFVNPFCREDNERITRR